MNIFSLPTLSRERTSVNSKQYHRDYYEAHKEKWEKDKGKRRHYSEGYYQKNAERLREKGREYTAKYRKKNPEQVLQATERCRVRRGQRNRAFVEAYKAFFGCQRCGELDVAVLDLHHRDKAEKDFTISKWTFRASLMALARELEKCEVLCANDHRREHSRTKSGKT